MYVFYDCYNNMQLLSYLSWAKCLISKNTQKFTNIFLRKTEEMKWNKKGLCESLAFTCSKSTIETLKNGVKYVKS